MKTIYLLVLIGLCLGNDGTLYSVDQRLGKYLISEGKSATALAWGYYKHEVMQDGWGKLYIWTSDRFDAHDYSLKTSYAAGYLEGSLTYEHIYNHYWSWHDFTFGKEQVDIKLEEYLIEQYEYARMLVKQNKGDEYYEALGRILAQNDGLYQAIQDKAPVNKKINWIQLLLLQACGDIYELKEAMKTKSERIQWHLLTPEEFEWEREKRISCSALIKALDDWSDVWMAHTTWTSYQNMLRIYKYYSFSGPNPYRVSFSSKPGLLYSKDDFYVLPDSNMVVIETTNSILDSSLYDLINAQSLLTWQRVPVAHAISNGGEKWTETFIRHNSGTYNNQYIAIDLKVVKKNGQAPEKDFIWISETVPGFAIVQDVTQQVITNGNYWKSYNIPYTPEVYDKAGYTEAVKKDPIKYSYELCPRGQMMKRDAPKVTSLDKMKEFIRYNDYKNDTLSQNNPGNAISSRLDLLETNPRAHGSIDGKVASLASVPLNIAYIQSGPTKDIQPVFSWTPQFTGIHWGQPTTFNFSWVEVKEEIIP
ncbi:unnamed protein product [Paramecium sonneborni]|uniref:Phospholipase B-like n=1 Tax=Paramecium sonneborni TaxID=65129 RepID=A0A8S1PWM7_9CILI|nr:unnamed protein product [Paramecium sonneborni]